MSLELEYDAKEKYAYLFLFLSYRESGRELAKSLEAGQSHVTGWT